VPTRFSPFGRNEVRRNLLSPEEYAPQLFIGGDILQGFEPTTAPAQLGFWGATFHDKQINAAMLESGNATTWVFNNVLDPLVPGEQRFVSLGAGMLMRQQSGEIEDGWKGLSNRLSPVQNVADVDRALQFRDIDFDANRYTDEWRDSGANATLISLAQREGFDLEGMLRGARNLDHFMYIQNRVLTHAQAMQNVRQWEQDAGFTVKWSSRVASLAGNYLLTDPSFAPSLLIGPGSGRLAGQALKAGAKTVRLAAPVIGGQRALQAGRTTSWAFRAPDAAHAGLAAVMGHRAARAVEYGVYGGVWDLAIQQQRISESEMLFDDPAHQQHFSWAELGLATGIGAGLGFALAGRGSANLERARVGATEVANGSPASPVARSFDNLRAQGRLDAAAIDFQRAAMKVVGDDFDSLATYLDDALLTEAGLTRFDVTLVMEEMAGALGGKQLPAAAVHRVMSDLLKEATDTRATREALFGAAGNQMEQAAVANALGRAARELPVQASNDDILRRAHSLVAEELQALEDRLFAKAQQTSPAAPDSAAYWKQEAVELQDAASRRTLTPAELDYLGTVDGKLRSLGEPSALEGFAVQRAARYESGVLFNPLRTRRGGELTKAVQRAAQARRDIAELTGARTLGEDVATKLKSARGRLKRAETAIQREADVAAQEAAEPIEARRVRSIVDRLKSEPPRTRADRFRALDEIANAMDFNAAAVIEDATALGKLLQGWGGGRFLRSIAQAGTGMDQTRRATLGVLREIAHEFDSAKLRVGDLDPTQARVHRTLEDIRTDMHVRSSSLVDEYRRVHQSGKFGSSWRHPFKYQRARADFDRAVIKHIVGVETSSDADVLAMAKLWAKHADEIGAVGEATGTFERLDRFFPRRINTGAVSKDERRFRDALSRHFLRQWEQSDEVHLDTLVSMGRAERVVDDDGLFRNRWVLTSATRKDGVIEVSKREVSSLKRTELATLGVEDDAYLKALNTPDADGFTPMQASAQRAKNSLLGNDTFETASNGKLKIKRAGAPASEAERQLDNTIWSNPELDEFLDWRFLHGGAQYLQSTGFRVMNNARHMDRWGIPGLRMSETLEWLDSRLERLQKAADATARERQEWQTGINQLRQKLWLAEGRLPSVREHADKMHEFLTEVGVGSAGFLYGSGIGQAVLSTEVMQAILSRVYRPDDVVRRAHDIFKVAMKRGDIRDQIQSLGLTTRQYRTQTLDRLTGGAVHTEGFQFGLVPKLLAPWMDIWDTLAGRTSPHSASPLGRVAGAVAAIPKAGAATNMTVGGMDYFTTFSRMLHVQSMLDETGRFWRAAERTADALVEEAPRLDAVERAARQAAMDAGKTEAKAIKAGQRARLKAWVGVARKNGFGANWQVAERMQRAGLLRPERLAVLRQAGKQTRSLKDTGVFKTLDFTEMQKATFATKAEQDLFDDSFKSLRDMMVQTLHKRVSEQSLLQTPTTTTARTWAGRTHLAMTSFARSWYDNNILDTAQMPLRASSAMIMTYLFGETLNRTMRDLWRGRDIDDIVAQAKEDPDNYVARTLLNLPWLGAYGTLLRPAADALTLDGRMQRVDTGESAAEGAFAASTDVIFDAVHGVSPLAEDAEIQSRTWRTAARFLPGYRSWWAMLLAGGVRQAGGPHVTEFIEGSGRRRSFRTGGVRDIPDIPDPIEGEIQTGPAFPEDLSFLYPE
jgi:hypothetical protein